MKYLSNKQSEIDRLKQTLENNLRDFPIVETKPIKKIITIKDVLKFKK